MKTVLLYLTLLFSDNTTGIDINAEDMESLTKNIYFEARNQSVLGQAAVAEVTINRVKSEEYPDTVQDVVYQSKTVPSWKTGRPVPRLHKCQFSWYCDGKSDEIKNEDAYRTAQWVAYFYVKFYMFLPNIVDGATLYHADYVTPYWVDSKEQIAAIDDQIFYR